MFRLSQKDITHIQLSLAILGILTFIFVSSSSSANFKNRLFGAIFPVKTSFAASSVINLPPADDAYVRADQPGTNFGTSTGLEVDGSPIKISYLKFDLSNVSSTNLISAKLSLKIIDSSTSTQNVKLVDDTSWNETTINNNNKPALGATINTFKDGKSGNWLEIDLTPTVIATVGQLLSVGIDSTGNDGIDFNSKEASIDQPVLVLEYQSLDTPSPTPSASPLPTDTPTPTPTPTPLPDTDPVIVAAGDIACDPSSSSFNGGAGSTSSCHMLATANLISNINPTAVLLLGDNQYYCGSLSAFQQSYDLSWGKFKSVTRPSVGNHEYLTSGGTGCDASNTGAAGYFTYFGATAGNPSQGYYSYDIETWHMIVINTQCSSAGGCSATSPQGRWLAADLAAHTNSCVLAYYHIPLFSSGGRANNNSKALFQILYDNNADVVLTGHDHLYERFAPQDANGNYDPVRGIREFVVGTGGANHTSFTSTIWPNSEVRNDQTFGVLKMTLRPTGYDWVFVSEIGKTFTDSGSQECN